MAKKSKTPTTLQTFLLGLMAILPLMLTIAVIIWVAAFLNKFVGPESVFGGVLKHIGVQFVQNSFWGYFVGTGVVIVGIFVLGMILQRGLKERMARFVSRIMRRIPVVGMIYDMADQVVGMFDIKSDAELRSMTSVWVSFGGEGGTVLLCLLPSAEPVWIGSHKYLAVLVPTSPVPFGGALLFVPAEWVQRTPFGADGLGSIYVSMGVNVAHTMEKAGGNKPPESIDSKEPTKAESDEGD